MASFHRTDSHRLMITVSRMWIDRLQIEELLCEIRVDYKGESGVDKFIAKLKKALLAMPEQQVRPEDDWF